MSFQAIVPLVMTKRAESLKKSGGVDLDPVPGYRIPNMFDAAVDGKYKAMYIQGEDVAQSDPNTHHVEGGDECLWIY